VTPEQAILVFRRAIDPAIDAGEGNDWWREVQLELAAVVATLNLAAATEGIAWRHSCCRDVGDTPAGAAGRIRRHAARFCFVQ
jgi:hypothetical protein